MKKEIPKVTKEQRTHISLYPSSRGELYKGHKNKKEKKHSLKEETQN